MSGTSDHQAHHQRAKGEAMSSKDETKRTDDRGRDSRDRICRRSPRRWGSADLSTAVDQTSSQLIDIAVSPAPAGMKQLPQDQHGWVGQRAGHHLELPPVGLHGAAAAELIHDV
jgi:hypothetical protein